MSVQVINFKLRVYRVGLSVETASYVINVKNRTVQQYQKSIGIGIAILL